MTEPTNKELAAKLRVDADEIEAGNDDLIDRAEEAYKWATAENDHINPELVRDLLAALRDVEARIADLRSQIERKDKALGSRAGCSGNHR